MENLKLCESDYRFMRVVWDFAGRADDASTILTVLNMSITASYVIAAVMLVQLLLKRAPKNMLIFSGVWPPFGCAARCPFHRHSACFGSASST